MIGRIPASSTLPANEKIAGFLDLAIQTKFAYVNKLRARDARPYTVFGQKGT